MQQRQTRQSKPAAAVWSRYGRASRVLLRRQQYPPPKGEQGISGALPLIATGERAWGGTVFRAAVAITRTWPRRMVHNGESLPPSLLVCMTWVTYDPVIPQNRSLSYAADGGRVQSRSGIESLRGNFQTGVFDRQIERLC
jgi:hypothetical protein